MVDNHLHDLQLTVLMTTGRKRKKRKEKKRKERRTSVSQLSTRKAFK
jgi:hypothetical protein